LGWIAAATTACQPQPRSPGRTVADAWQAPPVDTWTPDALPPRQREIDEPANAPSAAQAAAVVNGARVDAARLNAILYEGRGAEVLEQLAVLEAARQRAAAIGIQVNPADIESERRLSLQRLQGSLQDVSGPKTSPDAEAALLETVLAQRKISRREFELFVERNAYLRRIAMPGVVVSEADLEAEFRLRYGERVHVRHIQLATPAQVERAQSDLRAGLAFAEAALRHSANTASAAEGGRLDPFTADDPRVPEGFRRAAFALSPGEASAPVRVGRWLHIIRVDRREPAMDVSMAAVRAELETAVRQRLAEDAMQDLFNELLDSVDVEVIEPTLRRAWEDRRGRQSGGAPAAGDTPWSDQP